MGQEKWYACIPISWRHAAGLRLHVVPRVNERVDSSYVQSVVTGVTGGERDGNQRVCKKTVNQCQHNVHVDEFANSLQTGTAGGWSERVKMRKLKSIANVDDDVLYVLRRRWLDMHRRCENTKRHEYVHYGARGITVCARWSGENGFTNFVLDMHATYGITGTSLDRIDNDGPYSPENCRWTTIAQQNRNTRRVIRVDDHGEQVTLTEYLKRHGDGRTSIFTARQRYAAGIPLDECVTSKPVVCKDRLYDRWRMLMRGHRNELCAKWLDFSIFADDVREMYDTWVKQHNGKQPGFRRVDVSKQYELTNIVLVPAYTRREQQKLVVNDNGQKVAMTNYISDHNDLRLPIQTIYTRIRNGWTIDQALRTPAYAYNGDVKDA